MQDTPGDVQDWARGGGRLSALDEGVVPRRVTAPALSGLVLSVVAVGSVTIWVGAEVGVDVVEQRGAVGGREDELQPIPVCGIGGYACRTSRTDTWITKRG